MTKQDGGTIERASRSRGGVYLAAVTRAPNPGITLCSSPPLRPDGRGLFGSARPCGTPPPAWFSPDRPPHFCFAAPGTYGVVVPGGGQEPGKGPSFAAPYVAAILAEMSLRCDMRGPGLIKRLPRVCGPNRPVQRRQYPRGRRRHQETSRGSLQILVHRVPDRLAPADAAVSRPLR